MRRSGVVISEATRLKVRALIRKVDELEAARPAPRHQGKLGRYTMEHWDSGDATTWEGAWGRAHSLSLGGRKPGLPMAQ